MESGGLLRLQGLSRDHRVKRVSPVPVKPVELCLAVRLSGTPVAVVNAVKPCPSARAL